jgi:hypothetical protein
MDNSGNSFREFMSEWELATFLMMSHEELEQIIESGELNGMYTVFQVERTFWQTVNDSETWVIDGIATAEIPQRIELETIIIDHRIFSRDKITEWLLERMK